MPRHPVPLSHLRERPLELGVAEINCSPNQGPFQDTAHLYLQTSAQYGQRRGVPSSALAHYTFCVTPTPFLYLLARAEEHSGDTEVRVETQDGGSLTLNHHLEGTALSDGCWVFMREINYCTSQCIKKKKNLRLRL